MKQKKIVLVFLISLLLFTFTSCNKKDYSETFFYYSTFIKVDIKNSSLSEEEIKEIFEQTEDLLLKYENMISTTNINSDIYKLNQSKEFLVNDEVKNLIEISKKYSEISEGSFDISIYPIVKLWDILNSKEPPSDDLIKGELRKVDYNNIIIDGNKISLKNEAMIDLGAVAKGYVLDKIYELYMDLGIKEAIINVGGNVKAIDDEKIVVGIVDPIEKSNVLLSVDVFDKAVSTTGVYERNFVYNDKLYHHIFDTKTGYPVFNDLMSVSVITKKGIKSDILSTLLFSKKIDEIKEIVKNSEDDIFVIIVNNKKEVLVSDNIINDIKLFSDDYEIKKIGF